MPHKTLALTFTHANAEWAAAEVEDAVAQAARLLCLDVPISGEFKFSMASGLSSRLCRLVDDCGWRKHPLPNILVVFRGRGLGRAGRIIIGRALEALDDAGYVIEWRYLPPEPGRRDESLLIYGFHGSDAQRWLAMARYMVSGPGFNEASWVLNESVLARALPIQADARSVIPERMFLHGGTSDAADRTVPRAGMCAGFAWEGVVRPADTGLEPPAIFERVARVLVGVSSEPHALQAHA